MYPNQSLNDRILSFAEKRRLFEKSNEKAVSTFVAMTPPKPKRTFAQDHYDKLKNLSIDINANVQPWLFKHQKTTLPKRPKFFQLSHEYEQIFNSYSEFKMVTRNRRSASLEQLYTVPCKNRCSKKAADDTKTSLYYSSVPVPSENHPKNDICWRKINNFKHNEQKIRSKTDTNSYAEIGDQGSMSDDDSLASSAADSEMARKRAERAKIVRRMTLIHYDQQEVAFKCRKSPQLFELVALITLEPNDGTIHPLVTGKFMPIIRYTFPGPDVSSHKISASVLVSLPLLCYPDVNRTSVKLPNDSEGEDESFVLIITDHTGDRKFAYCTRFVPRLLRSQNLNQNDAKVAQVPNLPEVLCLLSPVHAVQFYSDLVRQCVSCYKMNPDPKTLNNFLESCFSLSLPAPGQRIVFEYSISSTNQRRTQLTNRCTDLPCNGLKYLLERLGVENAIVLFASLLSERRVLIVGDCISSLSKVIQAAAAMLLPFEWPHTLIPVVPDSYVQLCFSPTPYLIGVLRSNLHELKHLLLTNDDDEDYCEEYLLIYDLDYGVVKQRDFSKSVQETDDNYACRALPKCAVRFLNRRLKASTCSVKKQSNQSASRRCTVLANDNQLADVFVACLAILVFDYREFIVRQQDDRLTFSKDQFTKSAGLPGGPKNYPSMSVSGRRTFLLWFVETGMFQVWMRRCLADFNKIVKSPEENYAQAKLDNTIEQMRSGKWDSSRSFDQRNLMLKNSRAKSWMRTVARRCSNVLGGKKNK